MAEPLADQIMRKAGQVAELYQRLMLVVAPAGAGKTTALQAVRDLTGAPLVNVIGNGKNEMILLDNLEVIFDVELKQDPLRLLQGLSRNKTVVAAWNGTIVEDSLIYATPAHPEYRRYPMRDFLVVSPEVKT
jgi:hypothetical protein